MPPSSIRLRGVSYPNAAAIPPKVWLDDKPLRHEKSLKIGSHSIHGFGWGSNVRGGAQLALAICSEIYPTPIAVQAAPLFRAMFLDKITGENFDLHLDLTAFNKEVMGQLN